MAILLSQHTAFISDKLEIKNSAAKHYHSSGSSTQFAPQKAYDGDITTPYTPNAFTSQQDNFLKLYLAEEFPIYSVKITNRADCCQERIVGTLVSVYSTKSGGETKIADCGDKITGKRDQIDLINSVFSLSGNVCLYKIYLTKNLFIVQLTRRTTS